MQKKKVVEEAEATDPANGVAEAGPSEVAPAATNGEQETGEKKKKKKKRSAEEATAAVADAAQAAEPVKKKKKKDIAAINGEVEPTTEKKVGSASSVTQSIALALLSMLRVLVLTACFSACRRKRRPRWRALKCSRACKSSGCFVGGTLQISMLSIVKFGSIAVAVTCLRERF